MAEEKTPIEDMEQAVSDLEASAEGEIQGLQDKVASAFFDKVKLFFYSGLASVIAAAPKWAEPTTNSVADVLKQMTEESRQTRIGTLIENLRTGVSDPQDMMDFLDEWSENFPGMQWLATAYNFLILFGGIVGAYNDAIKMRASQTLMDEERPSLIPIEPLIDVIFKRPDQESDARDVLGKLGIPDDQIEMLLASATNVLGPEGIQQAFLRGKIDDTRLRELLKAHHLSDESIELLKELYEVIPPVQDLVTMAVREVFSPEVVTRFGQMEDFPPDFAREAKKLGLTEQWAKNYWAAHWRLPSPLQAFEMLHRDVITQEELNVLLRALDIMPYWRDKLTEIAYRPLTRVDVRRMHKRGVLDDAGVTRAYKDIGYNDYNAGLMTEFTKAYNIDTDRELTRTDIISLFKRKGLSETDAVQRLMDIGYPEDRAWLILYRAVLEEETKMKNKAISAIGKLYVAGKISETDAVAQLGKYNLAANEVNNLFDVWDLDRQSKVRNLTVKDLERFYIEKVIDETALFNELRELGYNVEDSNRFVALFKKGG